MKKVGARCTLEANASKLLFKISLKFQLCFSAEHVLARLVTIKSGRNLGENNVHFVNSVLSRLLFTNSVIFVYLFHIYVNLLTDKKSTPSKKKKLVRTKELGTSTK